MGKLCFGVDLGGTTVKMGVFTVEGSLLSDWEIPTRKEEKGKYILDDIAESIKAKIEEEAISPEDVVGVGIGVPGPVTSTGIVKGCVKQAYDDPVYLMNEAECELMIAEAYARLFLL